MKITLANNFHNTSTETTACVAGEGRWWVSKAEAARVRKALCGVADCTCGGNLGERPALESVPDDDYDGWFVYVEER